MAKFPKNAKISIKKFSGILMKITFFNSYRPIHIGFSPFPSKNPKKSIMDILSPSIEGSAKRSLLYESKDICVKNKMYVTARWRGSQRAFHVKFCQHTPIMVSQLFTKKNSEKIFRGGLGGADIGIFK